MNVTNPAIVITGGFGFIGSNLVEFLNKKGIIPYVIDSWKGDNDPKARNIRGLKFRRIESIDSLKSQLPKPIIVALGASVDTKEGMSELLWKNNVDSLIALKESASKFIYASSGATYGAEEKDFSERLNLKPLNPYAQTKLYLDDYFFGESNISSDIPIYGLRFMNVYGPREIHKGDMASLVTKGLLKKEPIWKNGKWYLFKHSDKFQIRRDFIFVEDVVKIISHFVEGQIPSGIYNVGTGMPNSFENLVKTIQESPIEYVPMPQSLINQYQRYTCANIDKLRIMANYKDSFTSMQSGVEKTRKWMVEEKLIN